MPDPLKNAARTIIGPPKGTVAGRAAVPPTRRAAPAAGAARPPQSGTSNLPQPAPLRRPAAGQTTNLSQPAPLRNPANLPATAYIINVASIDKESLYSIPYRYRLNPYTMVFNNILANQYTRELIWDDSFRRDEFLTAMKSNMSGDYNAKEAAVVCRIFEEDIQFMFYEKAIQEIRQRAIILGATDPPILNTYRTKFSELKHILTTRRTLSPPFNFTRKALWFASVSNSTNAYLPSAREHAGSIYFDGGRIRLMHTDGPILEQGTPARTLNGTQLIRYKPNDAKDFDNRIHEIQQREGIEATTLIEYYGTGGRHKSRGYPKTVNLSDEDIAQLYHLAKRITLMRDSSHYWQLRGMGIGKQDIIDASNKLMADFIRNRGGLRTALGY